MSEAARNGFEIPGWPGGDYVGPKSETILAGADIFVGGLCFIRRNDRVFLATTTAILALRSPWQRVRHHSWSNGYKCRVFGNTLVVYSPGGTKQRLLMLPETAVLVPPNGDVMTLDLRTLRLPKTRAAEGAWRITVHDICPPLVLPTPASQGAPEPPTTGVGFGSESRHAGGVKGWCSQN
jgi:hypothetical protein